MDSKEKLKTLKDIDSYLLNSLVRKLLKEEAIKWVKEDKEQVKFSPIGDLALIKLWMNRLNITEEELK